MGWKRGQIGLLGVALFLLFVAPASATVRHGPKGMGFYSPPAKLLKGAHGTVVWARRLTGPAVLKAASRNVLVIYRSVSPLGKPVFVSGIVMIPKGKPPAAGWPVISWDHGASGVADRCAPSHGYRNFEDRQIVLPRFLRAGFAVVQSDYQGLGTPGLHPYLIGVSEGRSVIDLVRAARALDRGIGRRWLPIGVSQGGHVTLWSASVGPRWAPELRVLGAVALAPSSHLKQQFEIGKTLTVPAPAQLAGAALAIAGAATVGFDPKQILNARGMELQSQVYSRCYEELQRRDSLGGVAPRDVLRADAKWKGLYRILDANEPGNLSIKAPVFIGQGTKDTTVPAPFTAALVAELRSHGTSVQYRQYPVAHGAPEVIAAYNDYSRFIAARFHHNL